MTTDNKTVPNSYLVNRVQLTVTQANKPVIHFYSNPLAFPVLQLFDFSLLFTVGIDPNRLLKGIDYHCRFIAHYKEGKKLNQKDNPYKNITRLEPIMIRPNLMLRELQMIRQMLEQLLPPVALAEISEV